jgi:hypothetical protein
MKFYFVRKSKGSLNLQFGRKEREKTKMDIRKNSPSKLNLLVSNIRIKNNSKLHDLHEGKRILYILLYCVDLDAMYEHKYINEYSYKLYVVFGRI